MPPEPDHGATDGGAERAVWEALRDQLPDDVVVFVNLLLLDGPDEREIDALVAWPDLGLCVVEVKGGHVSRRDGQWVQGSGTRAYEIDPVFQARRARHTLHDLLRQHGLHAWRARTADLVVLPHTVVPHGWASAGSPAGTVVGREDLDQLAAHVKRAIDVHGTGHAHLAADDVAPLVDFLGGAFPSQVEVLASAAQIEDRVEQMTRDQARMLDHLRSFDRLRIIGGAGSGKTWLALEQARRRAAAGERVALVCYSRGLGRYLERITATWPPKQRPAFVGLFHDLPLQWGAAPGSDDDADYFERRLPLQLAELADARDEAERFDCVVVDEAQDFSALWWPSLVRCLRDREAGGLWVFMDEDQRIFDRDGSAPITLPPVRLDENLRSTKQIAQCFGSFGTSTVKPRGAAGAPVRLVDVPADGAVTTADRVVDALLDEGWQPGQIALLTTGRRHPEQVNAVEMGGHAVYWDRFFAGEDVFYGHVLGFKGLERTVVVLVANGFRDSGRARSMLYTGLSRARVLLVLVGPRGEVERIGGDGVRSRLRHASSWSVEGDDDD
ncbi:nuclease-related domain-containing DEAD/DEAH box helicase [Cellulomonas endophytica]|uniref:nuclease-related domain-containing DEAD/DEAH box helicase n=1 Tax=Cellulomonas endophytica TaxID=2494735 RepID=UPI0010122279|nr:NERD domain-containing protein/DEAD/DEAH box helicase [Cellulomonas endophytica]